MILLCLHLFHQSVSAMLQEGICPTSSDLCGLIILHRFTDRLSGCRRRARTRGFSSICTLQRPGDGSLVADILCMTGELWEALPCTSH